MGFFDWLKGNKKEETISSRPKTPPKTEPRIILPNDTNLTTELRSRIGEALTEVVNSGKKIDESLFMAIPADFEWKNYDKWFAIFKEKNAWPRQWAGAQRYNSFLLDYPQRSLNHILPTVSKQTIIVLAEKNNISLKKSLKKQDLIPAFLLAIQGKEDIIKQSLLNESFNTYNSWMLEEKKRLLLNTLLSIVYEEKNLISYRKSNVIKEVELLVDDDACVFCKQFKGKKYHPDNSPVPGIDTHPGCRCSLLPIVDD